MQRLQRPKGHETRLLAACRKATPCSQYRGLGFRLQGLVFMIGFTGFKSLTRVFKGFKVVPGLQGSVRGLWHEALSAVSLTQGFQAVGFVLSHPLPSTTSAVHNQVEARISEHDQLKYRMSSLGSTLGVPQNLTLPRGSKVVPFLGFIYRIL